MKVLVHFLRGNTEAILNISTQKQQVNGRLCFGCSSCSRLGVSKLYKGPDSKYFRLVGHIQSVLQLLSTMANIATDCM